MKTMTAVFALALCIGQAWASADSANEAANPLQKVLQMLGQMEHGIIKDGDAMHHAFTEFSNMCENRAQELQQEIKVATSQLEDMAATIDKANDDEGEAESMIEEISATLSSSENDLKAATKIRAKEVGEFAENQKDLLDTISQMERAISIIEKQMKGGASFAQTRLQTRREEAEEETKQQRFVALTAALSAIVDASFVDTADASSLSAFIQTSEAAADADSQFATAADSYSSSQTGGKGSASILDTLEGLLEKAQASLAGARIRESKSGANFLLFKASLERKIAVAKADMANVKKEKAEAGQTRAEAEGDIEVVKRDLHEDKKAFGELHHECMTRAADYEDETKGRDEELKAVAAAKKVLKEMTGGAEKATYDDFTQVSFLQTRSRSGSGRMPPSFEAAQMVRKLGQTQNLPYFIQMGHKMDAMIRSGVVSGVDPFKKVKGMLTTMLDRIVKQMEEEASHKVYCDKEMSETQKHKDTKESLEEKLSTKIDTQTSRSMNLKRLVAMLQKELLANQKVQKEMDRMRHEENAIFKKTKPELDMGLEGVKKALKVLREYYSQDEDKSQDAAGGAGGAGAGVIGMLEVIESDFSKGIASLLAEEDAAQAAYEGQTRENKAAKAIKDQEVVFKTKEASSLDKSTSESSTDLDGVQTELDAIREYFGKIQQECVAKPDSYEERRKRQETTLQGLQDAAQVLEGKAVLLQGGSARSLRGIQRD